MNHNMLPLISIVIPSFNQGAYLTQAIESILAQDYPKTEIVLMDGGSADHSPEIIQKYKDNFKHWKSEPDQGQSAAINQGMNYCEGDLVAWLNADDFYLERGLWHIARAYLNAPSRGLYIGNGLRYREGTGSFEPFCPRHIALDRNALRVGLDYVLQPSTFIARYAWDAVSGLDEALKYGMDWDLWIRISDLYPAVLINEFISASREHPYTKTATGEMERARELLRLAQNVSEEQITIGSSYYLFETLLSVLDESEFPEVKNPVYWAMNMLRERMREAWGAEDPFPVRSDTQDTNYLPIAKSRPIEVISPHIIEREKLPTISVIIPSYNQASFLRRCIESVLNQNYPGLEVIIIDGESSDESLSIIQEYSDYLAVWISEPDSGPAEAINKGLALAGGEIVGWLNSDDMLAEGALLEIGEYFVANPESEVVYGNAIYIDEKDEIYLVDYGSHKTAFYYGKQQPPGDIYKFWTYSHAIPQPTVYFKRSLIDRLGVLDNSYKNIFDFELFWRFAEKSEFRKIESTLAFYRIHGESKSFQWEDFLVELYEFSRPRWPSFFSKNFYRVGKSYLRSYMGRRGFSRKHLLYWIELFAIGLSLLTGVGNPEKRLAGLKKPETPMSGEQIEQSSKIAPDLHSYSVDVSGRKYDSIFCSLFWPMHPGHSGGEIRDFHIIRHLLSLSRVDYLGLSRLHSYGRHDYLKKYLDRYIDSNILQKTRPDLIIQDAHKGSLRRRIIRWIRRHHLPILGPRYHEDVSNFNSRADAYGIRPLIELIANRPPDFIFISPQHNPTMLSYLTNVGDYPGRTRTILATYDVESVRISRLSKTLNGFRRLAWKYEASRAERYERDNLDCFDGIIAVSAHDKDIFASRYGFERRRILVLENGVDTGYFAFKPAISQQGKNVVFIGQLGYPPNNQAALRLLECIMPLVRKAIPEAKCFCVGANPTVQLLSMANQNNFITGRVDDVRPFLHTASVVALPLVTGSGTKYKLLEAMSSGAPTICTPIGIEGFADEIQEHVLIGDTDSEISELLIRVLQSPMDYANMVSGGRKLVEERYSWDAILEKLEPWLAEIASMPRRKIV